MSLDQFKEAKEANQTKWTSESWRKVEATAMGSSLQKIDQVKSWERRCNNSNIVSRYPAARKCFHNTPYPQSEIMLEFCTEKKLTQSFFKL